MWGYPLAHRIDTVPKVLAVKGIGLNSFQKFDRLKTAEDRFVVTPNNLMIDSYTFFDVKDGPVVVFVQKLAERRWFIVQIGDAFDDVILNVGGSREPVRCRRGRRASWRGAGVVAAEAALARDADRAVELMTAHLNATARQLETTAAAEANGDTTAAAGDDGR